MNAHIALVATSNAPAGARGSVEVEAENEEGNTTATISVKLIRLDPGVYPVSVTLKSTNAAVDLGIIDTSNLPSERGVTASESQVTLPTGVSPMDIATLTISNSDGVTLLRGDFVKLSAKSTLSFNSIVQLVGGTGFTNVNGTARVIFVGRAGKLSGHTSLLGKGLPAKERLAVVANGQVVGSLKTTKKGVAAFGRLPKVRLQMLHSIELKDSNGQQVATAHF